ncbi:DNA polymerase III subunit epsilon [Tropicimonas sp. TH_r6]|uniref:DNA polymerase III subunit epsilon n=1 Tax=Tropicimonas sp. TH_r6 TaxID=3082085 RepID=UPI00295333A7|nr:DNA polymerase III subunit epsilon [Tropicimonas sp. TH_r6]MDV7141283.1 DNA polymerase III subunit epsilon [Tropicimonas sp. TH_r6]
MREIVMDTETTGLDPFDGHRIVEIGGVELENHVPTGRTYHQYINPRRDMPIEAFNVHGLSEQFLSDKPLFEVIAQDFVGFVGDAVLVIHNAPFDMKFLNAELDWAGFPQLPLKQALDTLEMARKRFAGSNNTLDGLCRRFNIDNSSRTLHGALLDSEILADVYLELIGGRQPDFALATNAQANRTTGTAWRPKPRSTALPARLTEEERAAHAKLIESLGDDALWKTFEA